MKPFSLELGPLDPVKTFESLQHLPYALFLDSADSSHPASRYSFICAFPVEMIEAKDGFITTTNTRGQQRFEGDPFTLLKDRIDHWKISEETLYGLPPFQGGAAGMFGYDLARSIEELPTSAANNPDMPDMAIGIYDQVIAFDLNANKSWLITHAKDEKEARTKQSYMLRAIEEPTQTQESSQPPLNWRSNFNKKSYKTAVQKTIDYIRAGDIFQANLSQRFDADLPDNFCPFSHYKNLRSVNAAPFACYMNLDSIQISSASPERFLFSRNNMVETRPIKGTHKRDPHPGIDQFHKNTLENSNKDRAENTMIVDLLRNDLSKSCEPDTIEVTDLCKLESFARVHHLVSTVTGLLSEGLHETDLLRGCFPGGSITGAPKPRAMEIIEELEGTRRGPYCGAIGYIGFDGTMDTNILIRTLVYEAGSVSFNAGGGIVIESDPEAEYKETLDKASAIFESFEDKPQRKKVAA